MTARIVEADSATGRVVEQVVALAADHPHLDAPRAAPGRGETVVSSLEVEADLARLPRHEQPVEPGRGRVGIGDAHAHRAVGTSLDLRDVVALGHEHVDLVGQQPVEAVCEGRQPVAPRDERRLELSADEAVVLGRQVADGRRDRRVVQLPLHGADRLLPVRPRQRRQQPAIDVARVPGEALHLRVARAVDDEARRPQPRHREGRALQLREGLVAVVRDREPGTALPRAAPAPLQLVAVPVADQHVDQACAQERARVDALARVLQLPLVQLRRAQHLVDSRELRRRVAAARDLLERAEHAGERLAEPAEAVVVGHHEERRLRVQHAHPVQQRPDDQRRGGQLGGRLILEHAAHERGPQHAGQQLRRQLVHRAEAVLAAARRLELERERLHPATLVDDREPAVVPAQVEHRDTDRRRPQAPVVFAEQQPPRARGLVALAGRDLDGRPAHRRLDGTARARRRLAQCVRGRRHGGGQGERQRRPE